MKKTLLVLSVLGGVAGAAQAQSSVTLYGVVDDGIDYTNNVHGQKVYEMASGFASNNRWGLKGSEDLGGGLQAVFALENGFDLNSGKLGQGGREFGRQAFVGLSSARAGMLTLGRQYDSVNDYLAPLTANGNWGGTLFSHPYDNDNTDGTFRIDNSVKYTSVNYNGLQFGGVYGFSNAAGSFANNRAYSLGASYTNGPLVLGAAYLDIDNVGAGTSGAVSADDASFIAGRERVFGAGVNYTIAAATLGFVYSNASYTNPTANVYDAGFAGAASLKFNNFEFNAKYQFTPSFFLAGMYTYTQGSFDALPGVGNSAKPKWHQFGLMADYNLSKRTDVYVQAQYQKVAGGSTGTTLDTANIVGTDGSSSTSKQFVGRVGLRHTF